MPIYTVNVTVEVAAEDGTEAADYVLEALARGQRKAVIEVLTHSCEFAHEDEDDDEETR